MTSSRFTERSDSELLADCRQGDRSSFGELYKRYAPALFLYAQSLSGESAEAEDVVQEVFARLLSYPQERLPDVVRPFIYAIARNLIADQHRRASTRQRTAPTLLQIAECSDSQPGDAERVSRSLNLLPGDQREVVILKIWGDLTFSEIGELLSAPPATITSRYRYALEKLGQILTQK